MKLNPNEIEFKKKVGKSGSADVFHIKTIGGLHLMAKTKASGANEILSIGPHRAVARHLAGKYDDGVVWTELSKSSDHYNTNDFEHLLPEWDAVTQQMRSLQQGK